MLNRDVVSNATKISTMVAFTLNFVLIVVIVTRSSKQIGSYRYLLLAYTMIQLFSSVFVHLGVPVYAVTNNGIVFYSNSKHLGQFWSTFMLFGFTVCFLSLGFVLALSFIYRYFVFFNPHKLEILERRISVILVIIVLTITTALYETFLIVYFRPQPQLQDLLRISGADSSVDGYIALPIFSTTGSLEIPSLLAICSWGGTTFVCVIAVVVITMRMMKKFKQTVLNITNSKNLVRMHRKLFLLLVLQTAIPAFLIFFPILIIFIPPYLGVTINVVADVMPLLLTISQLLDPILIFIMVPDYLKVVTDVYKNNCIGSGSMTLDVTKTTSTGANT